MENSKHLPYIFFTLILLFIVQVSGCGSSGDSPSTSNDSVPVNMAVSISFTDTDKDSGQLGGEISITPATDENDITHYVLYWGSNSTTKQSVIPIANIAKTGGIVTHRFAANTVKPTLATHYLVFSKNSVGEMKTGISMAIVDVANQLVHPGTFLSQEMVDAIIASYESGDSARMDLWNLMLSSDRGVVGDSRRVPPTDLFGTDFGDPAKWAGPGLIRYVMEYIVTGSLTAEQNAIDILNEWAGIESFTPDVTGDSLGHHRLVGGINLGYLYVAADLLLSHGTSWSTTDQERFVDVTRNILLPIISENRPVHFNGNWDLLCSWSILAISVFLDDKDMFDQEIEYVKSGNTNARLTYDLLPSGQNQETGRDQSHALMNIQAAMYVAQIAWNQGIDLFEGKTYSIGRAFEHYVLYNEGEDDVPFQKKNNTLNPNTSDHKDAAAPSLIGRGTSYFNIFEMVYAHYKNYRQTELPNVKALIDSRAVEQPGGNVNMHTAFLFKDLPGIQSTDPTTDVSVTLQADENPKLPLVLKNISGGELVDKQRGVVFMVDGSDITSPGFDFIDPSADISGTSFPKLYQSYRRGNSSGYAVHSSSVVPNGTYLVRLHFAELTEQAAGDRIFDVYIEEQLEINNLDVFAEVGQNTALIKEVTTSVVDGVMNINLVRADSSDATGDTGTGTMKPFISGFEIIKN